MAPQIQNDMDSVVAIAVGVPTLVLGLPATILSVLYLYDKWEARRKNGT